GMREARPTAALPRMRSRRLILASFALMARVLVCFARRYSPKVATPGSEAELALDRVDAAEHLLVLGLDQPADLAHRADDRRVILATKALAQLGVARPEALPADVHREHAREAHRAVAPLGLEV